VATLVPLIEQALEYQISGSGTLLLRISLRMVSAIPCDQTVDVIAIRPVGAKRLFVEQTLDPTSGANLVGVSLGAYRPTHLAVPTTA